MIPILSVSNMRNSDAATIQSGISGRTLMGRAGEAVCEEIRKHCPDEEGAMGILCGTGNNAGDGYVVAEALMRAGRTNVTLILSGERFSDDGRFYFDKCMQAGIPAILFGPDTDLCTYGVLVDCLLGTGFRGTPEGTIAEMISKTNRARDTVGTRVISVDINSGLNGDTGLYRSCVRSDLTVSIGSFKPGLFLNDAKDVIAEKANRDIGIVPVQEPWWLWEREDAAKSFAARKNRSNKSTYGYVALIGGCLRYSGAIRLAEMANCAMRSGAGVVTVAAPRCICHDIAPAVLESTLFPLSDDGDGIVFEKTEWEELLKKVHAAVFGMGIGSSPETGKALEYTLSQFTGYLAIDADGLNALAAMGAKGIGLLKQTKAKVVLTPHVLEFARLYGAMKGGERIEISQVLENGVSMANEYASATGTVVLLKGETTVITDGETVLFTDRGCPGMATAGSGDVLSGIMGALLGGLHSAGEERSLVETAATAAYLNGIAGEMAQKKNGAVSQIASDTAQMIKDAVLWIHSGGEFGIE